MTLKRILSKCERDRTLIIAPSVEMGANYKAHIQLEAECKAAGALEFFPHLPVSLVLANSPLEYRRAVELLGFFFQYEFGYDNRPYHADYPEPNDRIYVWTSGCCFDVGERKEGHYAVVGVCAFEWQDAEMRLTWVYLHPCFRKKKDNRLVWNQKGRLEEAWPLFRKLHGDFRIPFPHSPAITGFLRKMNESVDKYGKLQPKAEAVESLETPKSNSITT